MRTLSTDDLFEVMDIAFEEMAGCEPLKDTPYVYDWERRAENGFFMGVKQAFLDHGFVVVENFMTEDKVAKLREEVDTALAEYDEPINGDKEFSDERVFISPKNIAPGYAEMRDKEGVAGINVRAVPDVGFIDIFNVHRLLSEESKEIVEEHGPGSFIPAIISGYDDREWCFDNPNLYLRRSMGDCAGWHYDRAYGGLKAFVYLTDVETVDDGPYSYALGTHKEEKLRAINKKIGDRTGCIYAFYEFFNRARRVHALAKKGALILSDQAGAHRGWYQEQGHERYILVYMIDGLKNGK